MISLIPQWKQSYKFMTQIGAAALTVMSTLVAFANTKENLPEILSFLGVFKVSLAAFSSWVAAAGVVLMVFRVIQQSIPVPREVQAALVQVAVNTPVTSAEPDKPLTPISPEPPK